MFEHLDVSLSEGWRMFVHGVEKTLWGGRMFHLPHHLNNQNLGDLREDMVTAARKHGGPLLLVCDSRGGSPVAVKQFVVRMHDMDVPVVTMARRKVCNEAVLILANGYLRGMRESAHLTLNGICVNSSGAKQPENDLRYRLGRSLRDELERIVGQSLPDELFRPQAKPVSYTRSKVYGLVDTFYSEPPRELLQEARRRSGMTKAERLTLE